MMLNPMSYIASNSDRVVSKRVRGVRIRLARAGQTGRTAKTSQTGRTGIDEEDKRISDGVSNQ